MSCPLQGRYAQWPGYTKPRGMLVANRFRRDVATKPADSSIPVSVIHISHSELLEFDTSRPGNEDWKRGVRVGDHVVLMSVISFGIFGILEHGLQSESFGLGWWSFGQLR